MTGRPGRGDPDRADYLAFVRDHHPDLGHDPVAFVEGLARFGAGRQEDPQDDRPDQDRFDAPVTAVTRRRGVRALPGHLRRWRERRRRRFRVL